MYATVGVAAMTLAAEPLRDQYVTGFGQPAGAAPPFRAPSSCLPLCAFSHVRRPAVAPDQRRLGRAL